MVAAVNCNRIRGNIHCIGLITMTIANSFPHKNQVRRQRESERMKTVMAARHRIEMLQDLRDIGVSPQDYHLIEPSYLHQ